MKSAPEKRFHLPNQPESGLDNTRPIRLCGDFAEAGVSRAQRRWTELGMVYDIERLGAELHAEGLDNRDVLDHGGVQVIDPLRAQVGEALREGTNIRRELLARNCIETG